MTDDARVYKALSATGIPGTWYEWENDTVPPLPWFTYYQSNGGWTFADGENYKLMPRYVAELYIKEKDPTLLAAFEQAVRGIGPFTRRDTWLESEGCVMYRFAFTALPEKGE